MSKILSVSQLNNYIKGMFLDEILLHDIEIFGEITEFNISGNNTYITVREGECVLSCIKFGTFERLPVGMKVLLSGTVTFYDKGGRISFNIKDIKPYGEGEQFLRLKKLKDKLANEGLFENRPALPKKISSVAVVTSASGAVIHDILSVWKNRIKIDVYVYAVKVQGDGADKEIAAAIKDINTFKKVDCIIVARGGGAFTDLDIFNSEITARAVAHSATPIVSAVGHETDYTLCDLCAGVRAGTPSIAAETIAALNDALFYRIEKCSQRLNKAVTDKLISIDRRLYRACHSISITAEKRIVNSYNALKYACKRLSASVGSKLDNSYNEAVNASQSVKTVMDNLISDKEKRYSESDKKLEILSPLKILSKGYARIKKNGNTVFKVNDIDEKDAIDVVMSDGILYANVIKKKIYKVK